MLCGSEIGSLVAAAIPATSAGGGLVDVCGPSMAVHDINALQFRQRVFSEADSTGRLRHLREEQKRGRRWKPRTGMQDQL